MFLLADYVLLGEEPDELSAGSSMPLLGDFILLGDYLPLGDLTDSGEETPPADTFAGSANLTKAAHTFSITGWHPPVFNGVIEVSLHKYPIFLYPDNLGGVNGTIASRTCSGSAVYHPPVAGSLSFTFPSKILYSTGYTTALTSGVLTYELPKRTIAATASFIPLVNGSADLAIHTPVLVAEPQLWPIYQGTLDYSRPSPIIEFTGQAFGVFAGSLTSELSRLSLIANGPINPPPTFYGYLNKDRSYLFMESPGGINLPVFTGLISSGIINRKLLSAQNLPIPAIYGAANSLLRPRPILMSNIVNLYNRFPYRVTVNMIKERESAPKMTLYAGDNGIQFEVQVRTTNNEILPIRDADFYQFLFQRPEEDELLIREPRFLSNGDDGLFAYDLTADELSVYGPWRFQLVLGFNGTIKRSEIIRFKVRQGLPIGV